MAVMRLDKYLATCGVGSRLQCKALIKQGLVLVNGRPAQKGEDKVDTADQIEVDGVLQRYRPYYYVMMHKPQGVLSATYDKYQPTVVDLLEGAYGNRDLAPVGRLDEDTTGLLLLSDDGALAHFLLSPKRHVPKVYHATLAKPVTQDMIDAFACGLDLGDFTTQSALLEPLGEDRAAVTLHEGKFHQVKRMFHAVGNEVLALHRVSFGPLVLDDTLEPGQWRELTAEEEQALRANMPR